MGISIYYEARRPGGMTEQEQEAVEAVVRSYSVADQIEEYHQTGFGWMGMTSASMIRRSTRLTPILEGATRLPDQDEEVFWIAVQHRCDALSEIRRLLPDADWHVHVDDHDIRSGRGKPVLRPRGEPPSGQEMQQIKE